MLSDVGKAKSLTDAQNELVFLTRLNEAERYVLEAIAGGKYSCSIPDFSEKIANEIGTFHPDWIVEYHSVEETKISW